MSRRVTQKSKKKRGTKIGKRPFLFCNYITCLSYRCTYKFFCGFFWGHAFCCYDIILPTGGENENTIKYLRCAFKRRCCNFGLSTYRYAHRRPWPSSTSASFPMFVNRPGWLYKSAAGLSERYIPTSKRRPDWSPKRIEIIQHKGLAIDRIFGLVGHRSTNLYSRCTCWSSEAVNSF